MGNLLVFLNCLNGGGRGKRSKIVLRLIINRLQLFTGELHRIKGDYWRQISNYHLEFLLFWLRGGKKRTDSDIDCILPWN